MIAESVAVAALALGLDFAFGDPRNRYHPTAWAGGLIARLTALVRRTGQTAERTGGILVVAVPVAIVVSLLLALYHGISLISSEWVGIAASVVLGALLLKSTIAIRGLEAHAMAVVESLETGSLDSARESLSMIVKRDTSELDRNHVISGVLESISENTVDGITGSLFYYAIFGLFGAFAYRIVNTADSMIGYKTDGFRDMGWFAAKSDTVLNYIPSRLTGLVMVASAAILQNNWRGAYRTMVRDGAKTDSLNAGYPMAALAGALGTRLEKVGHYTLGSGETPLTREHVRSAMDMAKLTSILFFGMVAVPIVAILSLIGGRALA